MIKSSHAYALLIFLTFSLVACMQPAADPKTVADKYWQHLQAGNISEAEKLISDKSQQALAEHNKRIATIDQLENGEAITLVRTTITTINPENNDHHSETFNTTLVLQQGQWKVDVTQTQIPPAPSARHEELKQLAEELSESMQENIESIDDAMSEGMKRLNEALQEGSKDMGDSLLHLLNELNSTMHESINKMKERREKQLQEQQPGQPDPDKGEGMI